MRTHDAAIVGVDLEVLALVELERFRERPAENDVPDTAAILRHNLEAITGRIAAACRRVGRAPEDVRLLPVTKTRHAGILADLISLGVRAFGENRIQEAEPKITSLAPHAQAIDWHLIGHLQSNKVRRAVTLFSWLHAIDSAELLERVDRIAGEEKQHPRVLLEINVSGEDSKFGARDEQTLDALFRAAQNARHVTVVGLMTMAPLASDPEQARPHFRRLRELRDARASRLAPEFRELSMGMSGDFEVAIEEGATCVRVGSALFTGIHESLAEAAEPRPAPDESAKDG